MAAPALAVIDAQFCSPDATTLAVAKPFSMSGSDFTVTDSNGAAVLHAEGVLLSLRRRALLLDATRRPVLTIQDSALLMNTRWKVFRGDSTNRRNLLFSVVKSSVIQLSTKIQVFLASNSAEQVCDFRIGGSYHDGCCTVSLGDSNTVIAKINRRFNVVSALLGRGTYSVTVDAGIDYAFIVALVVILDEMYYQR